MMVVTAWFRSALLPLDQDGFIAELHQEILQENVKSLNWRWRKWVAKQDNPKHTSGGINEWVKQKKVNILELSKYYWL